MTGLRLSNIGKSYGETRVLSGIDLDIAVGEFVAVLGPSGCGKTTLLRLVAGFDRPDEGTITLGDRQVAGGNVMVPPEGRGIGIVFQNYALWPHMSVAENVGYALKVARLPRAEREARVARALDTVNLAPFAGRRPADLSGGQRQRVALARCLAAGSDLVLLDEPLANLDVHLRATMEDEFHRFHRESGATLVYITHDQSEAMALADRIAVMDKGRLLQCASPRQLYREPADATVAGFIGGGLVLPVEGLRPMGNGLAMADLLGTRVRLRCHAGETARPLAMASTHPADIQPVHPGEAGIPARVTARTYRGGSWSYELRPETDPSLRLPMVLPDTATPPEPGARLDLAFRDLWAIPLSGTSAPGAAPIPSSSSSHLTEQFQCA
ncbi:MULTISPECIES: ABC transporter ATP-binding protein [Paracoccus]|uniref:Carbohydrate ABC transporter ATP-binding protein, CUT1 family n=1 Tax=Paracoccus denitrificans (strain Pd 1222) TaxID=318586 RepID=A1B0Z2_PARDP|nr:MULTISPECIES: ABC transporter ATP-binding protein [Paracoccus]ABL69186.1 carbohydrate ABC transporter ATP-binding protein, CUT1 family [Paracoccus denitrificans PD1222]MBB4629018.1 iron(III) transport system ATP-binding protein [Paracoccus denitrificans]MCU7430035.1 ABC transporter ATP-binding protein [Paracoccus denitrificans]MDK8875479.1 ABC transporter ATP-binding protein [Paracoccus sp. SSJ]QAR27200.1 ABC transporter ATP-binding protein [Paracoccus denitrificans]